MSHRCFFNEQACFSDDDIIESSLFFLFQGSKFWCKLKFILASEFEQKLRLKIPQSVLSIEFGGSKGRQFHRAIKEVDLDNIKSKNIASNLTFLQKRFAWSKTIRSAALMAKKSCRAKRRIQSNKSREPFYVIHLRATDKKCVTKLYSPDGLVAKLQADFGELYQNNGTVYLMTDLPIESEYIKVIQKSFDSRFCHAADVSIFKKRPFCNDNYLVYATEKSLLESSDGFVDTYGLGFLKPGMRLLGNLAKVECDKADKKKLGLLKESDSMLKTEKISFNESN